MTPDPIYRHIGMLIKTRRQKLEMNQERLAKKLGISRGSLANIETGRQNILVHQLYRIAAALDLTPVDFLPPPSMDQVSTWHSELPLPDYLKSQQKKQIADILMQVDTNPKPISGGNHAKITKR